IDFSGCERYVDTPVKRYSSGMRVRLAFAVAAFLEPDILVIDEVLAVGDAEFQKKAIGKMQDISKGEGRTVLFVSHNMAAVKSLCTRAIVLEHGRVVFEGGTDEGVQFYLKEGVNTESTLRNFSKNLFLNNSFRINSIGIKSRNKRYGDVITRNDDVTILLEIEKTNKDELVIVLPFKNNEGEVILVTNSILGELKVNFEGIKTIEMNIPKMFFNATNFSIDLMITDGKKQLFNEPDVLQFMVIDEEKNLGSWFGKSPGWLKPKFNWTIING